MKINYPFTLNSEDEASKFVAEFAGHFFVLHCAAHGHRPDEELADLMGVAMRLAMAGVEQTLPTSH